MADEEQLKYGFVLRYPADKSDITVLSMNRGTIVM